MMSEHPAEDRLNDYVDDLLPAGERAEVAAHVRRCEPCGEEIRRLEAVLARLHALPRVLPVGEDLRPGIRSRIGLGAPRVPVSIRRVALWPWRRELAAAALLLVVLSSAATMWIVRERSASYAASGASGISEPADGPASLAEFRVLETDYNEAVDELQQVLHEQREVLDSATVQLLEHNLQVIDAAISESRAALQADPGSPVLKQMLLSNYRHKVEVLRRAAALQTTI